LERLRGKAAGTLFRNGENGYSVISLQTGEGPVTVTGTFPELSQGETLSVEGTWTQHPQYGRQFRAAAFTVEAPQTRGAIEAYLGSGLIKGVGPSTARLIVQAFGEDTLEVLATAPERLREVPKIGKVRMRQIAQSFLEQQASRSTYIFLQRYGVTPALSAKINKLYREQAERLIRDNPYRLIDDIQGVGFATADRIAQAIGIPADSAFRLRAGLKFVLQDAAGAGGHTCLPEEVLLLQAAELLGAGKEPVEREARALILNKELFADRMDGEDRLSLSRFRTAEAEVARRLLSLAAAPRQTAMGSVRQKIAAFERRNGIRFSPTQRQAVTQAAQSGLIVITGGPGTGKTTLINCILYVLGPERNVLLAAPTGRAAKRMAEATGQEASTVHRLLQYGGEEGLFQVNQSNPLDCDGVIVDEVSMMDVFLMRSLLSALQEGTHLILVGDADQLPSVGPGNVLSDVLSCGLIPQVRLTEIFRQQEGSLIVLNAHRINRGEEPELNAQGGDFFFERRAEPQAAAACIVELCRTRLPGYLKLGEDARGIQVLSPTRKGECGVIALNLLLQAALNPKAPGKAEIAFGETVFRAGDKVMHVKNNYLLEWTARDGAAGQGVFNGDIGFVTDILEDGRLVKVLYDEEREVVYEYALLEELELAYCLSVHKSQGSEFPAVVMPMTGGPRMLLTRNLLYTGVTRAKELVVLVGRVEVLRQMVRNNQERRRYSALGHWLRVMGGGA